MRMTEIKRFTVTSKVHDVNDDDDDASNDHDDDDDDDDDDDEEYPKGPNLEKIQDLEIFKRA